MDFTVSNLNQSKGQKIVCVKEKGAKFNLLETLEINKLNRDQNF